MLNIFSKNKKGLIVKLFSTLALCLFIISNAQAKILVYSEAVDVVVGQAAVNFVVKDESSTVLNTLTSTTNYLYFEVNEDSPKMVFNAFTYEAKVTVRLWNTDVDGNGTPDAVHMETLTLNYDPNTKHLSDAKAFKKYKDAVRMEITVDQISAVGTGWDGIAPDMRVKAEVIVDRDFTLYPFLVYINQDPDYVSSDPNHNISWTSIIGADEYDFEWTFYDENSTVGQTILAGNGASLTVPPLFKNNATRVNTKDNNFTIQSLYPKGYIFHRVRGVKTQIDGTKIYSPWYYGSGLNQIKFYAIDWHEGENLNFTSSIEYGAEGRHLPAINYFDDAGMPRQNVALNNEIEKSVYENIIYDAFGRVALTTLPAPTGAYHLSFDPLQSVNSDNLPYGIPDFVEGNYSLVPEKMGKLHGVGRYYSELNDDVDLSELKLINHVPNADGYPFKVTEYTGDFTGRKARESMAGKEMQFETGHDTRYFYGKPSQEELDRLFGNDVGYASHYQKNLVIDGNGQAAVSYGDISGNIIATSLAGPVPDNLLQIDSGFENSDTLPVNLLANVPPSDFELVSTYKHIATSEGENTFYYSVNELKFQDTCVDNTICYDCLYDIEIKVTDSRFNEFNNGVPFIIEMSNFSMESLLDTLCADTITGNAMDTLFVLDLPIGEYTISKTLRLSESSLDYYTDHFMKNQTCVVIDSFYNDYLDDIDLDGCGITCETCIAALGTEADFTTDLIATVVAAEGSMTQAEAEAVYDLRVKECEALCGTFSECDVYLGMLMTDVTPLGQYARFEYNDQDVFTVPDNDVTSIFYADKYTLIYNQGEEYLDEDGNPDMVYNTAGDLVPPSALTPKEFVKAFKPSWALLLARLFHPEWCEYDEWCNGPYDDSADYDAELLEYDCFAEAIADGYVNADGTFNDPFFNSTNDPTGECQDLLDDMMNNISWGDDLSPSVIDYVTDLIYGNCSDTLVVDCSPLSNEAWTAYVAIYLGFKNQIITQKRAENTDCGIAACVGTGNINCNGNLNFYAFKEKRISHDVLIGDPLTAEDIQNAADSIAMELELQCASTCDENANFWMQDISACNVQGITLQELRDRLIAVCVAGCDFYHSEGSSTTANGLVSSMGDTSFEQILLDYTNADYCSEDCSPLSIGSMRPHETPMHPGPTPTNTLTNTCICENLTELEACFDNDTSGDYESFAEYLVKYSEYTLVQEQLDSLLYYCSSAYDEPILPYRFPIPAYLECSTCQDCDQIGDLVTQFSAICSSTAPNFWELFAPYANNALGFNQLAEDYEDFVDRCTDQIPDCEASMILCPTTGTLDQLEFAQANACVDGLLNQVSINAAIALDQALEALRLQFRNNYVNHCLNGAQEVFDGMLLNQQYHYTLYYYDQSGNIRQTIPPNGVHPISSETTLDSVKLFRADISNEAIYPKHDFISRYEFHGFNGVTKEVSPNEDLAQSWYDHLGRMILAQDGRQAENNLINYFLYDEIGRIAEVGEIQISMASYDISNILENEHFIEEVEFANWFNSIQLGGKSNMTKFYFDETPFNIDAFGTEGQQNLRIRIAAMTRKLVDDGQNDTYDFASHFSYDPTGRVKTLVQEIVELEDINQHQKRIDFVYDYISGNLSYQYYQKGKADQFTHHFEYNKGNRLKAVYTSFTDLNFIDGGIWEEESSLEYYEHGPVGRIEMGNLKIQGCDFAYTIQGWNKGMNSTVLDVDKDLGKDGNSSFTDRAFTARDVLGFTLSFYNGDYSSISGSQIEATIGTNANYNTSAGGLFNSNIRGMTVDNKKFSGAMAYTYKYDQLDRLKSMQSFDNINTANYEWGETPNIISDYAMAASYDGNGNLQTLTREGLAYPGATDPSNIDDLLYDYIPYTDKLSSVEENSSGCIENIYINDPVNLEAKYQALISVFGSSIVTGAENVIFQGEESVELLPGFEVEAENDKEFLAHIDNCVPLGLGDFDGNYVYDGTGNIIRTPEGDSIIWDAYDRIVEVRKNSNGNSITQFKYDANNRRIAKYDWDSATNAFLKTYYVRDATGNQLATYSVQDDSYKWKEQHIYAGSRFGIINDLASWNTNDTIPEVPHFVDQGKFYRGSKYYELINHLGNVLSVVNDRKLGFDTNADGNADYYEGTIVSANDYYPFGMHMPSRNYSAGSYNFGFNGMELDNDGEFGNIAHYNFGFRIYNPALGRFLSIDPLAQKFPYYTPYQFAGNSPIYAVDLDGAEGIPGFISGAVGEYLSQGISNWFKSDETGWAAVKGAFYDDINGKQIVASGVQSALSPTGTVSAISKAFRTGAKLGIEIYKESTELNDDGTERSLGQNIVDGTVSFLGGEFVEKKLLDPIVKVGGKGTIEQSEQAIVQATKNLKKFKWKAESKFPKGAEQRAKNLANAEKEYAQVMDDAVDAAILDAAPVLKPVAKVLENSKTKDTFKNTASDLIKEKPVEAIQNGLEGAGLPDFIDRVNEDGVLRRMFLSEDKKTYQYKSRNGAQIKPGS